MGYTSKAAVLRTPGGEMTIEEVEIAAPRVAEVLVRTMSAGICGTDLFFAAGRFPFPLPTVLGHEASGIVEAVGPGVTTVSPGDRVLVCDQAFCGRCAECLSGRMVYCSDRSRSERERHRIRQGDSVFRQYLGVSAYSQLVLVDENSLSALPDALSWESGALLGCCLTTGMATCMNVAAPAPGSSVLVIGCGGVGLGAVQGARICGAGLIIAVDLADHRRQAALAVGATDVFDGCDPGWLEAVLELTNGGVDRAIEAVGSVDTAQFAFSALRPGGKATIIGMLDPDRDITISGRFMRAGRSIGGTVMGEVRTRLDIPRYAHMAETGQLNTKEIATGSWPIEDINEAFAAAASRIGIRQMLTFA